MKTIYSTSDVDLLIRMYGAVRQAFPGVPISIGTDEGMRVLRASGDAAAVEKFCLGFAACARESIFLNLDVAPRREAGIDRVLADVEAAPTAEDVCMAGLHGTDDVYGDSNRGA